MQPNPHLPEPVGEPVVTSTELVLRETVIRGRLTQSQDRLSRALERLKVATQAVTPAQQIRARPYEWIAGGIAVGLFVGWVTASRR